MAKTPVSMRSPELICPVVYAEWGSPVPALFVYPALVCPSTVLIHVPFIQIHRATIDLILIYHRQHYALSILLGWPDARHIGHLASERPQCLSSARCRCRLQEEVVSVVLSGTCTCLCVGTEGSV